MNLQIVVTPDKYPSICSDLDEMRGHTFGMYQKLLCVNRGGIRVNRYDKSVGDKDLFLVPLNVSLRSHAHESMSVATPSVMYPLHEG